jgi:hypothetical protein
VKRCWLIAAGLLAVTFFGCAGAGDVLARGGASNIMNSPGYQRRLQESRGYVTNQSGSILPGQPVGVDPARPKVRRRY